MYFEINELAFDLKDYNRAFEIDNNRTTLRLLIKNSTYEDVVSALKNNTDAPFSVKAKDNSVVFENTIPADFRVNEFFLTDENENIKEKVHEVFMRFNFTT